MPFDHFAYLFCRPFAISAFCSLVADSTESESGASCTVSMPLVHSLAFPS